MNLRRSTTRREKGVIRKLCASCVKKKDMASTHVSSYSHISKKKKKTNPKGRVDSRKSDSQAKRRPKH